MRTLDRGHAAYPGIKSRLCDELALLDGSLRAPAPLSVATLRGDRFLAQWWCDVSGQYFALQVVDTQTPSQWELFHVPVEHGAVAGCRSLWESDPGKSALFQLWEGVFGPVLGEPLDGARVPSFVELLSAGTSSSGVTAVREDHALIAHLTSEVEYWTHLAKTLSKTQRPGRNRYYSEPHKADLSNQEPQAPAQQWKLSDIDVWASENAERIIILPRAINTTKRSNYEDAAFFYECLELLANEYTAVKTGAADRFAFKQKADALGLDYGGSVEPSTAGEFGDQYFIRWGGRRRFLDQHISKGNARDPRFCMRIYFTFDSDLKRVVIGSMPAHLDTSTS